MRCGVDQAGNGEPSTSAAQVISPWACADRACAPVRQGAIVADLADLLQAWCQPDSLPGSRLQTVAEWIAAAAAVDAVGAAWRDHDGQVRSALLAGPAAHVDAPTVATLAAAQMAGPPATVEAQTAGLAGSARETVIAALRIDAGDGPISLVAASREVRADARALVERLALRVGRAGDVMALPAPGLGDGEPTPASGARADRSEPAAAPGALPDGLPIPAVRVGAEGTITHLNAAWRAAATTTGADPRAVGRGASYLRACSQGRHDPDAEDGALAAWLARALPALLDGARGPLAATYRCHAPGQPSWFTLVAFPHPDQEGALLAHLPVRTRVGQPAVGGAQGCRDPLTGLPGRDCLAGRLSDLVATRRAATVLLIDLVGFKHLNDRLGRPVGDELLHRVAHRLTRALPATAFAGRLAGDVTVVLLPEHDAGAAHVVADEVRRALATPLRVADQLVELQARIWLAPVDHDESRWPSTPPAGSEAAAAEHLLVELESLREDSKQHDPAVGPIRSGAPHTLDAARRRLEVRAALGGALDGDELHLVYQPVFDQDAARTWGVEALARWHHHRLGPITPDEFVPVASALGLGVQLDRWVLGRALADHAAAGDTRALLLNVTPGTLTDPRALADLLALRHAWSRPPPLILEYPEALLPSTVAHWDEVTEILGAEGVGLAIDDFGTGYSALGELRHLPVAYLKLDRQLIAPIDHDLRARQLARAAVDFARALGAKVIAEGIERPTQLRVLHRFGTDAFQGFYLARPLAAPDRGQTAAAR